MADCESCTYSAEGGQTTVCCYFGSGETDPDGDCPYYQLDDEYKPTGCESTNHRVPEDCYGELWQCSRCGKSICHQEGSTDRPDLCDDCWRIVMLLNGEWIEHA